MNDGPIRHTADGLHGNQLSKATLHLAIDSLGAEYFPAYEALPFMIWGRYRKRWFRTYLTVSFQFHHTQMDGAHAARFLDLLQAEIQRCGQTE